MIVAIEPTWTGTIHAPGNSTLLDIAKLAFPDQQMAIHAEAGHIQEVKSLLKAAGSPTVSPLSDTAVTGVVTSTAPEQVLLASLPRPALSGRDAWWA